MHHSFDLHLHTFFSRDALHSPEKMVAAAREKGLSGIAITDHDSCEGVEYLRSKGWIRDNGEAVDDFLILPGMEISTQDGHLLCLGTTLPCMKGKPAKTVVKAIQERGGLAVAPHAFDRFRAGICEAVLEELELDALETFNAAVSMKRFNRQAALYAAHRGLSSIAGSDAHHSSSVGVSFTTYDLPRLSQEALLQAIRQGGTLAENYLPLREAVKKNMCNWFRFFNHGPGDEHKKSVINNDRSFSEKSFL